VDDRWTPSLLLRERDGRCLLSLGGVARGEGDTLQVAADDLIARLLDIALRLRASGITVTSELGPPDTRMLDFLWSVGELAAQGGDVRGYVLGTRESVRE
jgi:hypothetical protein